MLGILHVDMDQFYAAVEMRDDPRLAGRPVVIGSDPKQGRGRGVVSTANYLARRFGVHSAMPISQAYRLCPQAAFIEPDMAKYAAVSEQIQAVFLGVTPLVEPLSLDEAFMDVRASRLLYGDAEAIAARVKQQVLKQTRLTCSVGVAENKFLAKVASDLRKPDGLVVVPEGQARAWLAPMPVGRLWGVGAKSEERLKALGIASIGDLQAWPLEALARSLGAEQARHLAALARGEDSRTVEPGSEAKSIGRETTFEADTESRALLEMTLAELAEDVALRLRQQGLEAGRLTLKLRWQGFETHTHQRALKPPTSHGPEIHAAARALLCELLGRDRRKVRLLGLSASGLAQGQGQLSLDEARRDKARRADAAQDALNARFGDGTLKPASQLGPRPRRNRTGFSPQEPAPAGRRHAPLP
jgi:nucleotidyltransferase/DNA polymerase involved in DNA repair